MGQPFWFHYRDNMRSPSFSKVESSALIGHDGTARGAPPPGMNLDSVLSIVESRTVGQDYTVQWHGVLYRVEQKQIKPAMRGARVQLGRRLDGSTWMHWRNQVVVLQPCPETAHGPVTPAVIKRRTTPLKSTEEKARAKQRLLDARRQWRENYEHLRNRPIWQAMRDYPPAKGFS